MLPYVVRKLACVLIVLSFPRGGKARKILFGARRFMKQIKRGRERKLSPHNPSCFLFLVVSSVKRPTVLRVSPVLEIEATATRAIRHSIVFEIPPRYLHNRQQKILLLTGCGQSGTPPT